ncbi:sigma 54-interacting transcriptional regulator [Mesobacillus maritimus]|uniref:sigma-54 interaction domain-containing protein n=1 Tax=Mesobacillus maritimus TaxID=1643336 RepID=UPI00203FFE36|nr:sigma 54-interacting transcriptional regulator [Mesobacillus maritimus]MCM3588012.1 sigma 54-interacting transcriptional regulator [Mesobacillus maritimus]
MAAVLTDNLPFSMFITSSNGTIHYSNEYLVQNLPIKELNSKHIHEVFSNWQELRGGKIIYASCQGTNCIFMKEKLPHSEDFVFVGTFSSELTSLVEELEQARRVNRELDAIIENSYDGIYITDRNGVTVKTNSAIERITGIPKEYYLGKNVNDLMKRGILQNSVTHRVLEKRRVVSLVQENYLGRETLLTGNPVLNEEGDIEGVVTNIRDLSELNELQSALHKANELNNTYKKEIERLKGKGARPKGVIIRSDSMKTIYDTAARVANVDATVLILGETGTGKEVLARFIYENSERSRKGDFIKINCGAIPPDLLESELFGYVGGAFTGANSKGKPGMFELANEGVLFLDEVGELPLHLQVKLLRVIQEREVQRIGGMKPIRLDVRLIAATNRNLKEMVSKGTFREDLYYRLNVVPISIPPLSERKDDILPLVNYYFDVMNTKYQKQKKVSSALNDFFYQYNWPGNVRELANLIERMVLVTEEDLLMVAHLPTEYRESKEAAFQVNGLMTLKEAAEMAEERVLQLAVTKYSNTYQIAEALDSSQPTIVRKLKKYNLKLKDA